MKRLVCDIRLSGSTSQFLKWHIENSQRDQFVNAITSAITYRAKTLPYKQAKRSACLMGLIYDQFGGNEYLLDVLIEAVNKLELTK